MNAARTILVNVEDLVLDHEYQSRFSLDQGAVKKYAEAMKAGAEFPPITIGKVNGAPVVIDGWHRVTAARKIGRTTLPAILVENPEHELGWLAAEANLKHGVPLKRGELRNVFRAYVRAGQHKTGRRRIKSSREISSDLHGLISHTCVINWMREDFPAIWKQMARRDEEPRAEGGLPQIDPEERRLAAVRQATGEIIANARGITDPLRRGEIVTDLRQALDLIEKAAPWEPIDENEF